jgi:DNA-directed RNA polymerase subunit beta'
MEGEAVGIIAAQSIGEPGTQLTMRTFHTGGIAGEDITSGLPRVVELFEARSPKGEAVLSEIDGIASVVEERDVEGRIARRSVVVDSVEEYSDEYRLPEGCKALFNDGDTVNIGDRLVEADDAQDKDGEAIAVQAAELTARVAGTARVGDGSITISWEEKEEREYPVSAAATITVSDGSRVTAGDALTAGPKSPQQILRILGREAVQRYLNGEVQKVYRSQGVNIHDKHVDVILRQMLRRVQVDTPGDAEFIPGQIVDRFEFQNKNAKVLAEGGEPATAKSILLGVTRASLLTDSFLAAASFQETTRVLTEAAVSGARDRLLGLKENVIIGRLIPARAKDFTLETKQLTSAEELEGFAGPWFDIAEAPSTNVHENGHEAEEEIFEDSVAE